jgi:hypothetical protein
MHEKQVARAYRIELFIALAVYIVLLFGSIRIGRPMADGLARTLVLISPMIGFGLMIRTLVRQAARVDEYVRMRLLENIALAAAITVAVTFTYGFLETVGYPKMSMFVVWVLMAASFGVVNCVRAWVGR